MDADAVVIDRGAPLFTAETADAPHVANGRLRDRGLPLEWRASEGAS